VWSRSRPRPEASRYGRRLACAGALFLTTTASFACASEVADAVMILEAISPMPPDQVGAALPLRFALLESGQVFVGGTSRILAGRLGKDEMTLLERRMNEVRKLPDLASTVTFGPEPAEVRLSFRKSKPLEVVVKGDPDRAPAGLQSLATLVSELLRFDHASLLPYEPTSYALGVREGKLVGGCRPWTLPLTLAEAESTPQTLPASAVTGWPTGATPAFVCAGDKTYVVSLRPLVPGERP
jgi:hypothetical protein